PPPLVTLLLGVLLFSLFVRGQLVVLRRWLSPHFSGLANFSHALTLLTLFFASAQALNSVLPERGLLHWLFSLFLFWTLINQQFSPFDARRLLRSLGVLFGTAFVLKYLILSNLSAPEGGWLRQIAGTLLQGATLGTLDVPNFAPATGYLSFFTLGLYVLGLALLIPATDDEGDQSLLPEFLRAYGELSPADRIRVHQALLIKQEPLSSPEAAKAVPEKAETLMRD
ncbi:MAG TPA: hypothetical protein VM870_05205, partial [Pyrinomonadaceae bacterium]|nr:hypothetical protein [Pyrinomonadaceae bacterium]